MRRPDDGTTAPRADSWTRRGFLGATIAAGLAGCAPGDTPDPMARGETSEPTADALAADAERRLASDNIYTRLLGIRPHVPAHGHATALGGSRMPAEVLDAMREANDYFVMMDELTVSAGARVAELVNAEAALVTSGASGGLLLGAAACLTGTDVEKMHALPHPTWSRRECLIQKANRYPYDRAIRSAGMVFVEVEGRDQLLAALGDDTAMIFALPSHDAALGRETPSNVLSPEELIAIGKDAGVPVMVDGASRLPPPTNLTTYNDLGADLVVISGGKGLEGPQSTGILSGRADLIEAARLQAAPNDHIGRGMKVGKEEIIGLVVALERYRSLDHARRRQEWTRKAEYVARQLQGIPGLEATMVATGEEAPYVELQWDEAAIGISRGALRTTLRRREDHRLAISTLYGGNRVQTLCMRDGEEVLAARYLRAFFTDEGARS